MRIGEVLRYGRPYSPEIGFVDGVRNYFHETFYPGAALPLLERGISPIAKVKGIDGIARRPAVLISSSPHKKGTHETPWQDYFDPDNGYIRYCGDNKNPNKSPESATGNKILLEEYSKHHSPSLEERKEASPIVFFERVRYEGRAKGFIKFQGFGIIRNVELVVQYDHKNQRPFTNYIFSFSVFDLSRENEMFNWDWINKRRENSIALDEADSYAPYSWRHWIKHGDKVTGICERRVSRLSTVSSREQKPGPGPVEKALDDIYEYYSQKKHHFESLASLVTSRLLIRHGNRYIQGWITPPARDGGADFVGRLDLGEGLSAIKLIVLGQAKCQTIKQATSGKDIARTVARLKRGWIGVYVTTSHFSEEVQQEVIEDAYPIMLVNGSTVAKEVLAMIHEEGYGSIKELLEELEEQHESKIMRKRPEEILFLK